MHIKIEFDINDEIDKKTKKRIKAYIPEYVESWLKGERVQNLTVDKS